MTVVAGCIPAARAGFCTADSAPQEPHHEFQFFGGYSPQSSTFIGSESDRRLVLAGFSYRYRCWSWNPVSLSYTAGVMPAAIMMVPAQTYRVYGGYFRNVAGHAVYGVAVAPVGLVLDFGRARRFHPFLETIEGVIASTEPIPENQPDASGLNFLFDFGVGLRWNIGAKRAVTLGYKFFHISNAGTTDFNPGVDNNVFYLGYSFLR